MRKSKIIRLDDTRELTIKEISPRMMMSIFEDGDSSGFNRDALEKICRDACGLSLEDLQGLYPSELDQLWTTFREINDFFFKAATLFGLQEIPAQLGASLCGTFGGVFADLLSTATTPPPTTDGPVS